MLISKTINSAPGTMPNCIILIFCVRAPEDISFNHAFAVINFFKQFYFYEKNIYYIFSPKYFRKIPKITWMG